MHSSQLGGVSLRAWCSFCCGLALLIAADAVGVVTTPGWLPLGELGTGTYDERVGALYAGENHPTGAYAERLIGDYSMPRERESASSRKSAAAAN